MADVRTFVAATLDPEVLHALEELQGRLRRLDERRACRWVSAESIHLTFHFLGDVPAERLPEVFAAVARGCAGYPPLDIAIAGVGCFPNVRQPRIVWAGVREESGGLARLQGAIGQELERIGYSPERRPFTPHLTIGRIRRDAAPADTAALGRAVSAQPQEPLAAMRVTRVYVIKSDLRPSGPIYTTMATTELASGGPTFGPVGA